MVVNQLDTLYKISFDYRSLWHLVPICYEIHDGHLDLVCPGGQ